MKISYLNEIKGDLCNSPQESIESILSPKSILVSRVDLKDHNFELSGTFKETISKNRSKQPLFKVHYFN